MTPEEYEQCVADVLREEGWDAALTPKVRDLGIDVIAKRGEHRLAVQVKMYGDSARKVNSDEVMRLYGAAAFADCDERMIATDGDVWPDARTVAEKLDIEVRHIPAVHPTSAAGTDDQGGSVVESSALTFGSIWDHYVRPLEGSVLTRATGKKNRILKVDGGGVVRETSGGTRQRIGIETFRWTIERLLDGENVTRREIDAQNPRRVSSGIMLILASIPIFEPTDVGAAKAIRLASSVAARSGS